MSPKINKYRVDRNQSQVLTPVGMLSIVYIGGSLRLAEKVFSDTDPGFDSWGNPDPAYGLTLSYWNGEDYIVKKSKGFQDANN